MATETTKVSSYIQCEGYKNSAGTLISNLDTVVYAATGHAVVFGSAAITGSATVSLAAIGITTLSTFIYSKNVSCVDYMTLTATTGSNVTITFASGAAAATGTIYYMVVND
jgi:hypothetical protein